jgi:hypothetical protein
MVYDELRIAGKEYLLRAGKDRYVEDMVKYFPTERVAIEAFVELVEKVSKHDLYFNLKIVKPAWLQKLLSPLLCKSFFKYNQVRGTHTP